MALKLPDSAVPMGDFPVAKAVDIDFNDGENLQEKLDNGKLGGGGSSEKQDFRIFKSLEEFNEKKGTSFTVVSGVDNMKDIVNAMSNGEMLIITISYVSDSDVYFGLNASTGWTKIFTFIKADGLCDVECRTTSPFTFKRVLNVDGVIGDWQELATMDKVVKKIFIKDESSSDGKALIQNHWSEFDNAELYNVRLGTSKWTWNAEIYRHTQEFGTVLLRCYGSDTLDIFYGRLYKGIWTWTTLADSTKVSRLETQVSDLFQSVSDGKTLVANAITDKGVSTATAATFATMATNISKINTNGYKEETASWDKISTGANRIVFTFSSDIYGVKQITPPSDASSHIVPETSTGVFTINGRKLTLYVNGVGTWEVTAIVRNA